MSATWEKSGEVIPTPEQGLNVISPGRSSGYMMAKKSQPRKGLNVKATEPNPGNFSAQKTILPAYETISLK